MPSPFISPSERFRVLEIKLRFTSLKANKHGKIFYANLWINPNRKLKSKLIINTTKHGKNSTTDQWEEKFIFSVSEKFLFRDNSAILSFEIYRARKILHDSLLGIGQCDLKSLFKNSTDQECDWVEKQVVNDDDDDKIVEEYSNELPELKAFTSVQLSKESASNGTLSFDAVVWKGHITSVGDFKWQNVAMIYDDFMGHQANRAKEMRNNSWICFCASNTTTID